MKTYYTETIRKANDGFLATAWLAYGIEPLLTVSDANPEVAAWKLSEEVSKVRGDRFAPVWEKQMTDAVELARKNFPDCTFTYSRWDDETGLPTIEVRRGVYSCFVMRFIDETKPGLVNWHYEISRGAFNAIQHAAEKNVQLAVFLAAAVAMNDSAN